MRIQLPFKYMSTYIPELSTLPLRAFFDLTAFAFFVLTGEVSLISRERTASFVIPASRRRSFGLDRVLPPNWRDNVHVQDYIEINNK